MIDRAKMKSMGLTSSKVVLVTPKIAAKWLSNMCVNRPVRPLKVTVYAEDMKADAWDVNGHTIKFDIDGVMIDGQHRCLACIQSGCSFATHVVKGIDAKKSMHSIDSGLARSVGDFLDFEGYTNSRTLGAAANVLDEIRRDQPSKSRNYILRARESLTGKRAMAAFIKANPIIVPAVELGCSLRAAAAGLFTPSQLAGLYAALATTVDKELAQKFIEKLATGENLLRSSPIWKARNKVMKAQRSATANFTRPAILVIALRAWNYWISKTTLAYFSIHKNEEGRIMLPAICGPGDIPTKMARSGSLGRQEYKQKKRKRKKVS